jgi:prepilin-type N-terminal cleavage/methylation domain-containing protein
MDAGVTMNKQFDSQSGVTLIETMIAMAVLTVGAVGLASAFLYGMNSATSGPNELIATQKAAEAIESVFSARDSHSVTWEQLQNVDAEDPDSPGIFLNGPYDMYLAGDDGVLNTDDDTETIESVELPGPDGYLGTEDDTTQTLTGFQREIAISELSDDLREITVVITYKAGTVTRTYTLTALISAFA